MKEVFRYQIWDISGPKYGKKFRSQIREITQATNMRNSIVQVTNMGNVLRHGYGKLFSEDEETLCLFLGHIFGKFEGSRFGK